MVGMTGVVELERRIAGQSVVLFLGNVDVGKTTLVRRLHERVGGEVVDADLGQAEIGPPAVISLGTYQGGARAGYFGGDISPRGHFLQVLTGCKRMVAKAARPCLIDSDGYIQEGAARAFKSELINLIEPDLLVLLQRGRELEYYKLYASKGIAVVEIPVEHTGLKPHQERVRARERAFRRYFATAQLRRWRLEDVGFERALLGHGEPLDVGVLSKIIGCQVVTGWKSGREAVLVLSGLAASLPVLRSELDVDFVQLIERGALENRLVGCLVDGEFQGLGILQALNSETVDVLTPAAQASVLQVGSLKVREDGWHERVNIQKGDPLTSTLLKDSVESLL